DGETDPPIGAPARHSICCVRVAEIWPNAVARPDEADRVRPFHQPGGPTRFSASGQMDLTGNIYKYSIICLMGIKQQRARPQLPRLYASFGSFSDTGDASSSGTSRGRAGNSIPS